MNDFLQLSGDVVTVTVVVRHLRKAIGATGKTVSSSSGFDAEIVSRKVRPKKGTLPLSSEIGENCPQEQLLNVAHHRIGGKFNGGIKSEASEPRRGASKFIR